jgi:Na+/H+-translocating membrane pyrophosphatase
MNKEIKALWVEALISGKYTQAYETPKAFSGFCCLGVLCDLHIKATGNAWDNRKYFNEHGDLPCQVRDWAEIDKDTVDINDSYASVAKHNDKGRTFLEIADAIESQL